MLCNSLCVVYLFHFILGIYIKPTETGVKADFRGIGIRIEDDILITQGNPIILTESCIKNIREIENVVGTRELPE